MGLSRRIGAVCAATAAVVAAAWGCSGDNRTMVCIQSDCRQYYGTGGDYGIFGGGPPSAGTSGALPDGGTPPDAGIPGGPDGDAPDAGAADGGPAADCDLAFLVPSAGDAGSLTLDGSSDSDGEECGTSFHHPVTLTSNARSVTLFVNGAPLSTEQVLDGIVSFDAVLGNRGETPNSLRARAVMPDGSACTLDFPGQILVACAGPSCSISAPEANADGYLNASLDSDVASGLQTDVEVSTDVEHEGQMVRLQIDGSFGDVADSAVLDENGVGRASFAQVTLAEGQRSLRAQCSDAEGLTTLSAPVHVAVDLTPCTLSIDSIAGGVDPVTPGNDQSPQPGLQVIAAGQLSGEDCKAIRIGVCGGPVAPLPLPSPAGSFAVPLTLPGSSGSFDICATVEDFAGNIGPQDQIRVNLRLDPPQVAIASPAASTRYNRQGNVGAVADGDALSSSCEVDVAVNCTELGQPVALFADGSSLAQAPCLATGGLPSPFLGRASFTGVSLASKNDGATTFLTARQSAAGLPTGVSSAVGVQADCELPACSLVSPSASLDYLNGSLDSDVAAGFQIDFEVASDAESVGAGVALTIDGDTDGSLDATLAARGGGSGATISRVELAQGLHSVQARCLDAAGNEQTSDVEWTVDSVPCSANAISVAAGASPVTPALDANPAVSGLQASVSGQATGGDCSTVRVGLCGSLSGAFSALAGNQSFSGLEVTLASVTSSQDVCVQVLDEAGNLGEARASVAVRVDPPVVSIQSPANGVHFNVGTGCEATLLASCSDVGAPVVLFVDGVLADTQSCAAGNQVTLQASLPSKNDGSATTLSIRQSAGGLTSLDASVDVQADCEPPLLSFTGFSCGDQFALAGDDADTGTPGLQHDIAVANGASPDVTLTVTRGGVASDREAIGDNTSTVFSAVDLGGAGNLTLTACATDPQGNEGCTASCALTIAAEPVLAFTSPAANAVLSTLTPDCNAGAPGLQVTVQGTTSAANGSPIQVALGLGAPVQVSAANGTFSACVDAADGDGQTLAASVTDSVSGLSGSLARQVSVDTVPPSSTIAAPAFSILNRRSGLTKLDWTSIVDADGSPLSAYRLRCAASDITSEVAWAAATELSVPTTPSSSAGSAQTGNISGLAKAGMSRFCVLRGEDAGGQLSPISAGLSMSLNNPFHVQQYAITNNSTQNVALDPLGDINGDGIADFAYGVVNSGVEVFFGSTDLDANPSDVKTPSFVIRNTGAVGATLGFGSEVTGLGDINGDSIPDFATSARGANVVFVFFGRASNTWTNINLATLSPCPADLCIVGSGTGASGLFGWDITSANFDGAGPQDLVISGRSIASTQSNAGRVFVLLGGAQLATPGTTITLPASNPNGFIIDPPALRTNFGISVGSVTGTGGVDDLIIGANGGLTSSPAPATATANRVPGRAHTGSGLTTINANAEFENGPLGNYGNPVRALGDFNGDGRGDLMVGRNGNVGGIANVYLGLAGGGFSNQGSNLLIFANELFPGLDDNYGTFTAQGFEPGLGTLGDLDQDGATELLIGSTTPDVGAKGLAQLFYGSTTAAGRSRASADFTYTPQNTQVVPNFVGDINHDSFPDFALLDSGTGTSVIFLMY